MSNPKNKTQIDRRELLKQVAITAGAIGSGSLAGCSRSKESAQTKPRMKEMKKIFWDGCDDWDTLLNERAKVSGRLVLSEFTKEKLKRFA